MTLEECERTSFTMRTRRTAIAVLATAGSGWLMVACGGDDLSCGTGTERQGSKCVAAATAGDGGVEPDAGEEEAGFPPPEQETIDFDGIGSAAPAGADSIQITWRPAEYPLRPLAVLEYGVYVATESGAQNFNEPFQVAPPGSTSLVLEGLEGGTEYHIVVRALTEDGPAQDENTEEASATPQEDTEPPTFAGLTGAEPGGGSAVRVSWEAATDNLTPPEGIIYQVSWSDVAGGSSSGEVGGISLPGDASIVITGLPEPEANYFFHVTAIDAAGNTDENEAELGAMSGADETPPVFGGCRSVSNVKANGALVVWDPANDDTTPAEEIEYRIYAFDVPVDEDTNFLEAAQVFTGVESGQVNTLLESTFYRVVCRAVDKKGNEEKNRAIRTFTTLEDGQPPEFGGVVTVDARSTEADLSWEAATDNQTEQTEIIYQVYLAQTSGGHDFEAQPYAKSLPGATAMTIFNLPSNSDIFVVVRAIDEAGNFDTNTKEIERRTLVSFENDVQPIFTAACARDGCHKRPAPLQGQNLEPGFAYDAIVGVPAVGSPGEIRINPNSSVRTDSYLYRKITGTGTIAGVQMPPEGSGAAITPEQIETIGLWIEQGAERN